MAYEIEIKPWALEELRSLRKYDQARITVSCETHLISRPTHTSKSTIKKLEGVPGYRLRVDEFRVFYTVDEAAKKVSIQGVVPKSGMDAWLKNVASRVMMEVESGEDGNSPRS